MASIEHPAAHAMPNDGAPVLIELDRLNYSYPGPSGPVTVLRDVSLTIRQGEFVSILGASGGGKSTLLNLIGALEKPGSGRLVVGGRDLGLLGAAQAEQFRQGMVAFIFQFFNLLPTLTAYENVLLGMEAMAEPPADAAQRARRFLASVGLESKLERFPAQLSGGEQQRVAIARALAKGAPLILADEPTGNLDEDTATAVMDLIVAAQRDTGATLVLITHDAAIARRASRMLRLNKGRLQAFRHEDETDVAH